jgi:uncharacterized membrane protein YgcG
MPDLKQTFITAVRTTPAGIAGFLTTPIPEPPTISQPADVDAAIIVNGVCAWFILELFRPFAGLTPVELLLRIGQHNSVLESAMLAGLEYLEDTQAAQEFEIVEPTEGTAYSAGDFRVTARPKSNTIIKGLSGAVGAKTFVLKESEGVWQAWVIIADAGDYTMTLTATFETGDPVSKSVNFQVITNPEEEPRPPEGVDEPAVTQHETDVDDTYRKVLDDIQKKIVDVIPKGLDDLRKEIASLGSAAVFTGGGGGASGGGGATGTWTEEAQAAVDAAEELLPTIDDPGVADQIMQLVGQAAGSVKKLLAFLKDNV